MVANLVSSILFAVLRTVDNWLREIWILIFNGVLIHYGSKENCLPQARVCYYNAVTRDEGNKREPAIYLQ